jgi:hypothetical protein
MVLHRPVKFARLVAHSERNQGTQLLALRGAARTGINAKFEHNFKKIPLIGAGTLRVNQLRFLYRWTLDLLFSVGSLRLFRNPQRDGLPV